MEFQEYLFKNNKVNIYSDKENNSWFIGKEIATILGYKDTDKAIRNHVDTEDKHQSILPAILAGSIDSRLIYINESGLYSLILKSKMKEAKNFQRWVTSEVLPSIRKKGEYKLQESFEQKLAILSQKVEQEIEIKYKERIEEELKNKKQELIKNYKFQPREPTDVIYIMGTESNKEINVYKGKTTINNRNSRLSSYNTGSLEPREFLFEIECYDGYLIEIIISSVLNHLKYIRNGKIINEMYTICLADLILVIRMIVESQKLLFDYVNHNSESIYENYINSLKTIKEIIETEVVSSMKTICEKPKVDVNLNEWLWSLIEENKDNFVSLKEIIKRYKEDFPHRINKNIESDINKLFNDKGVYLIERYRSTINGKRLDRRKIYLGYIIK